MNIVELTELLSNQVGSMFDRVAHAHHHVAREFPFNLKVPALHHRIMVGRREELEQSNANHGIFVSRGEIAWHRWSGETGLVRGRIAQRKSHALARERCALARVIASLPVILLVPARRIGRRLARRVYAGKRITVKDVVSSSNDCLLVDGPSKVKPWSEIVPVRRSNVTTAPWPVRISFVDDLALQACDAIGAIQTKVRSRAVSSVVQAVDVVAQAEIQCKGG